MMLSLKQITKGNDVNNNQIENMASFVFDKIGEAAFAAILSRPDRVTESLIEGDEVVVDPDFWDDMSGDYYANRTIFHADGSVDIVSYKGEGEHSFESREEHAQWLADCEEAKNDQSNYYDDEDDYWVDEREDEDGRLDSQANHDSMVEACRF